MKRRVAITGIGLVTPLDSDCHDFFFNLMAGKSGIRRLTAGFADNLNTKIAAEAVFDPASHFSKKQLGLFDRTAQFALTAARAAWKASGLTLNEDEMRRAGVSIGTGLGGAQTIDDFYLQIYKKDAVRVSPLSITKIMCNSSASHISIEYGLKGPCLTYSTACSSSAVALGEAFRKIQHGYADVMLAGGAESFLTYGSFKCWESLGVMAHEDKDDLSSSCKPFSKDRTGFVLGEGAAVLVLEEMEKAKKRGAPILAEFAGYGTTADAFHITGPTIDGQAEAMRLAMQEAGFSADGIGYINAHGTATEANDVIETRAIKKIFGERAFKLPVSSTKSMHGHLMGAAGAVEFAVAVLSIINKAVPPTSTLKNPDPLCDLDYVPLAGRQDARVRSAMSNSFAFGGTNAALIAKEI